MQTLQQKVETCHVYHEQQTHKHSHTQLTVYKVDIKKMWKYFQSLAMTKVSEQSE